MAKRDYQALARGVGVAIVVLAVLVIAGSLVRLGEGLATDEPGALERAAFRTGALALVLAFGWYGRTGHPRARGYGWALIGPVLLGVVTPAGVVFLVLNVATAVISRKAAARSSSVGVDAEGV